MALRKLPHNAALQPCAFPSFRKTPAINSGRTYRKDCPKGGFLTMNISGKDAAAKKQICAAALFPK